MNGLISPGEFRLGLRLILKQPILSLTVILALATGIAVATIGFTFRDELVNGRLPYQAGDRFARIYAVDRAASFEYVGARIAAIWMPNVTARSAIGPPSKRSVMNRRRR